MLKRAALILRYKHPFVDWINATDPSLLAHPDFDRGQPGAHRVPVEVEDQDELAQWLARHHEDLFEQELNGWYTDPALWLRDRSLKMLREWCSLELHTVVVDTGASSLRDKSSKNEPWRATPVIWIVEPHTLTSGTR